MWAENMDPVPDVLLFLFAAGFLVGSGCRIPSRTPDPDHRKKGPSDVDQNLSVKGGSAGSDSVLLPAGHLGHHRKQAVLLLQSQVSPKLPQMDLSGPDWCSIRPTYSPVRPAHILLLQNCYR